MIIQNMADWSIRIFSVIKVSESQTPVKAETDQIYNQQNKLNITTSTATVHLFKCRMTNRPLERTCLGSRTQAVGQVCCDESVLETMICEDSESDGGKGMRSA